MTAPRIHPSAVIAADADVAEDACIGAFTLVGSHVRIGPGVTIGSHCAIGVDGPDDASLHLRTGSLIRSHTVIYLGSDIGRDFETGHQVIVREGMSIGDGVRVGTNSDLQGHARIGHFTRMHSGVQVNHGTTIEDFVWIFPYVVFTNDPHPPSDDATVGPTIARAAAIGARSLILPNLRVGEGSLVAAGSTVTKDVADGRVVLGAPARDIGPTTVVPWRVEREGSPYPWWNQFRRGYPSEVIWTENGPEYHAPSSRD